jgi:hypothetical protein
MTKHIDESAEIEAMKIVANALKDLDDNARNRVLTWATGKYDVKSAGTPGKPALPRAPSANSSAAQSQVDLPTTFTAAKPESGTDKALVVAYWFQVIKGSADVDAHKVNNELKHLGHGVINITRAFDHLMDSKPQLIIQTRKSGKAKQARKKYRVTAEGIARVKRLIAGKKVEPERS